MNSPRRHWKQFPKPKTYSQWLRLKFILDLLKENRRFMRAIRRKIRRQIKKAKWLWKMRSGRLRIRYRGYRNPAVMNCGVIHNWSTGKDITFDQKIPLTGYYWRERMHDYLHPGPPYKTGSPLLLVRYTYPKPLVNAKKHMPKPGYKEYYQGGFMPNHNYAAYDPALLDRDKIIDTGSGVGADRGDISQYGASAYTKFKPGNPTAQMGVFLRELGEVPRMLSTTSKALSDSWRAAGGDFWGWTPKKAADRWLATNFGWKPFLGDLNRFMETYKHLNESLEQIRRDNGQWVKRGGVVTVVRQNIANWHITTSSSMLPRLNPEFYNGSSSDGYYDVCTRMYKRIWFEARFKYWIPDTESELWKYATYARLMGLEPTPSMIHELIPFSWLLDWATNFGDFVSNFSLGYAENLVSKYAYIMGNTKYETVVDVFHDLYSGPVHYKFTALQQWKRREQASPFGFGFSEKDFTPKKWSILAALGIQYAG